MIKCPVDKVWDVIQSVKRALARVRKLEEPSLPSLHVEERASVSCERTTSRRGLVEEGEKMTQSQIRKKMAMARKTPTQEYAD